jgi:capsular polysaccharide biosynthesis protein
MLNLIRIVYDLPTIPPVKEQLELWSSHGVVVSAHGAGLMNLLLMPQMSAVVEVFPVHFHHNLYRYLAALTGVGHYPVHVANGSAMWSTDKVRLVL